MAKEKIAVSPEEAQRRASDPEASVWVSANAGSGKTHALTTRVTRLLLSGTDPQRILCLTFTKAAAAEMSSRLYGRLGAWAMMPDEKLADEIAQIEGRRPQQKELNAARKLFARAIETPGGLKIQTIHAFCERVLGSFPLEAGIPPHFEILDDVLAQELMSDVRDMVLGQAQTDENQQLKEALSYIVSRVDEASFASLLGEITSHRANFMKMVTTFGGLEGIHAAIRLALSVEPGEIVEGVLREIVSFPAAKMKRAIQVLSGGTKSDVKRSVELERIASLGKKKWEAAEDYLRVFLTSEMTPRESLMTKKLREENTATYDFLVEDQARVADLYSRLRAVRSAEATEAITTIALAILEAFDREKKTRAFLDYNDLIERTRYLLRESDMAPWVLYKLDGGIDHILVDEAQDTSPEQWDVISGLADEFLSGSGARSLMRTIFVVGDEKQSIFSFQGADPSRFQKMKDYFEGRVRGARLKWDYVPLTRSFRSVPEVLNAVDRVFQSDEARRSLTASGHAEAHIAHRELDAGLVEIWDLEESDKNDDDEFWDAPLDYISETNPMARLAVRIATTIKGWLDSKEIIEGKGRAVRPGDILILVRRRNAFVGEMVRALKAQGVNVAGADRMILMEQIAVMDLVALGHFALLPEDDLTLATVLKSPLIGFTEEQLLDLAWNRKGTLWLELQRRAETDEACHSAREFLSKVLERVDFQPPYEFFSQVLGEDRGREKFLERLGPDAADPLDEFMSLTLEFERTHVLSLEAFIHWVERGASEIKRDMDQGRDEVRIMTVHGAKGLEADVVFMPDTCAAPVGHHDPALLSLPSLGDDGPKLLLWPVRKKDEDELSGQARDLHRAAQADEYNRLLYVAMTRARDRLYIAGYGNPEKLPEGCWYSTVMNALRPEAEEISLPDGLKAWRIKGAQKRKTTPSVEHQTLASSELPDWVKRAAPSEPVQSRPLAPSRLAPVEYEEPLPLSPLAEGAPDRFLRGQLVHRLLEVLPDIPFEKRKDAALRFLSSASWALEDAEKQEIAESLLRILSDQSFGIVFAEGSRAEVPVAGMVQIGDSPILVTGKIDRLCVSEKEVLIVDYKTNRQPPKKPEDVPPAYIAQMAAYRALMAGIYKDIPVRCLLLWTDGPDIMELPAKMLDRAWQGKARTPATRLDLQPPRS